MEKERLRERLEISHHDKMKGFICESEFLLPGRIMDVILWLSAYRSMWVDAIVYVAWAEMKKSFLSGKIIGLRTLRSPPFKLLVSSSIQIGKRPAKN